MENITELEDKINNIESKIDELQEEANTLFKLKVKLVRQKYPEVWVIKCTPEKTYGTNLVGCFATKEEAEKLIGNGSSFDEDDTNMMWYYSVHKCSSKEVSDSSVGNIGSTPYGFPYTGR